MRIKPVSFPAPFLAGRCSALLAATIAAGAQTVNEVRAAHATKQSTRIGELL